MNLCESDSLESQIIFPIVNYPDRTLSIFPLENTSNINIKGAPHRVIGKSITYECLLNQSVSVSSKCSQ